MIEQLPELKIPDTNKEESPLYERGKVTILLFSGQGTSSQLDPLTAELERRASELTPEQRANLVLRPVAVVPGVPEGSVLGFGVVIMVERIATQRNVVILYDWMGDVSERLDLGTSEAHALIIGGTGKVLAYHSGEMTPGDVGNFITVLRVALS